MTPAQADLARRIVALPGFAWVSGMAWVADTTCPLCHGAGGFRWHEADGSENGETCDCSGRLASPRREWIGAVPDLTDDATAGALLGMLWRANPAAGWHVHGPPGLICAHNGGQSREFYGDTLGEAVAAGLVAIGRCS